MMARVVKYPQGRIGLVILILLTATALAAPLIAPYDPYAQHIERRLEGPSADFWMGTDYLGRCVLSRMIYGSRFSLEIAFLIVGVQVFVGLFLGALAGYAGGLADGVIMRLVDILMALPSIALALVLAGIMGPGPLSIVAAMCITGWSEYARIVRGDILALKEKEFVKSARAFGFSDAYILVRHVIPNILAPVIVLATLSTGFVIVLVAAFSFLGLGSQPPLADWGVMLSEGRAYMRTAPHLTLFPGLAVMATTLAFNLVGDTLRDAMDPRFKLTLLSGSLYAADRIEESQDRV